MNDWVFDFSLFDRLNEGKFVLQAQCRSRAQSLALVGASGAGKSLTMQCLAGLRRPEKAFIRVGGHLLADSDKGVWLPPQQRKIGLVFQDFALFPHLNVAQNIAFGLHKHWRNPPAKPQQPEVREWLERMNLTHIAQQYPHQISGGQKQRTALARACIAQPHCLLLDEPFSALDENLRREIRAAVADLRRHLNIPMLLISHDEADIHALADEVCRIDNGRLYSAQ